MSNATLETPGWAPLKPTALVVLADGLVLEGAGFGAIGEAVGEVCFNTSTVISSCRDSCPRGFMHRIEAAIGGTIRGAGTINVSFTRGF